ncbi:dTDP-4-dehydrorhamnose 3,5-epimerase family protein [Candidatus Pacearchaeota archaeon]|nr:dTDP-4-dehydrorhamnose 3,5-epimerase family protein [Candidatus Pacearchaeota archaeon]
MKKPEVIDVKTHADDRGYFIPITNLLNEELRKRIKRIYVVGNFGRGVVRGFHYHKKEIKIFFIARGAAKFIAINKDNPEEKYIFVTSDKNSQLVIIPPGYANGWMSLEEGTILIGISNATLEESLKDDIRFDPYKWGDVWEIKSR